MTEAARPAAEAAYAAHLAAVRGYFHGPEASDERRGRLLEVDFGANDTARLVCDFALGHVHGAAAARDRNLTKSARTPATMRISKSHTFQ